MERCSPMKRAVGSNSSIQMPLEPEACRARILRIGKQRTLIHLFILLVVCYFVFFFRIGAHDLWNPDEPRYAQVAREMLESGDWIVPHLNGKIYTEKPPLYFWLVALVSKPFGDVNETTARLPSAIATTLVVLLTYLFGNKLLGRQEAFWGALITATSAQFFTIGRSGVMDSLLTLFILAALMTFYVAYVHRRGLLYAPGFLFLAPAALSKGPVGVAVPLFIMLAFLFTELMLHKKEAGANLASFGLWAVLGVTLVALLIMPWWQAAYERSGGVYGSLSILTRQTVGRMHDSYSHNRPFYYYFVEILWLFLPWTVLSPLAGHAIKNAGNLKENTALRFLLIWFLSVFLLFTLISGKRAKYILPLGPAGALLLGWAIANSHPGEGTLKDRRGFRISILSLIILCFVGLAVLVVGSHLQFPQNFSMVLFLVVFSSIILLIGYKKSLEQPPVFALIFISAISIAMIAGAYGFVAPVIDKYKSARPFCDNILAAMTENDELCFYQFYRPNIHYYMHREVPVLQTEDEVINKLTESKRVFLIFQWKQRTALKLAPSYVTKQIVRSKVGDRDMLCVEIKRN
ncbi:MAG: hypothetical protein Kow0099_03170 [Candidatus Abyssubacteria bacterium]